jgi:hypothetical protein
LHKCLSFYALKSARTLPEYFLNVIWTLPETMFRHWDNNFQLISGPEKAWKALFTEDDV